ncbi:AraC family transcriptional regulator [Amorphus orientalis]|uniref:AraC-like DNA-binding protein n=1 Tax=Amorphus orientalis TaxID=649198 RepID=A0AAE4AS85_9HYPH|nr:AraC family transcriptional regulator [Amorphus orientalis]MDQ0314760.1 AraC-like DNA-binding protein [Amorphus orientalis]
MTAPDDDRSDPSRFAPQPFDDFSATEGASAGLAKRHVARFFRTHDIVTAPDLPGFRHSHAMVGALSLNHLTYGAQTIIGIPPLRDFYMLQWTLAGTATYRHDDREIRVSAGSLYVVNPDRRYEKVWDADCTQFIVRIDRETVDEVAARSYGRAGTDQAEPIAFATGAVGHSKRTTGLFSFLQSIAADARTDGNGWAHHRLAHRVAPLLAELLLISVDHSAEGDVGARGPSRPRALGAAEDFIKVHARDTIRLQEIADAAGVRPRTLHKIFREHLGVSPIAYLRQVRLDLARRDLRAAAASGQSVTEVATGCGFDHLSKFARFYKERFGESPSDTVRRHRTA